MKDDFELTEGFFEIYSYYKARFSIMEIKIVFHNLLSVFLMGAK